MSDAPDVADATDVADASDVADVTDATDAIDPTDATDDTKPRDCVDDPGPGDTGIVIPPPSPFVTDPAGGPEKFTLAQAFAGFPPGDGRWVAEITTSLGKFSCTLDEVAAPITVANFVGLARGTRPYSNRPSAGWPWATGRYYDANICQVQPDTFVLFGKCEKGWPGFQLPFENQVEMPAIGALIMVHGEGPLISGDPMINLRASKWRAGEHPNVFGSCAPLTVPGEISRAPTGTLGRPSPLIPISIAIRRCRA